MQNSAKATGESDVSLSNITETLNSVKLSTDSWSSAIFSVQETIAKLEGVISQRFSDAERHNKEASQALMADVCGAIAQPQSDLLNVNRDTVEKLSAIQDSLAALQSSLANASNDLQQCSSRDEVGAVHQVRDLSKPYLR